MAFPTTSQTLADALSDSLRTAASLKTYAQQAYDHMAVASVSANQLVDFYLVLIDAQTRLTAAAGVSGIAAYAQDQLGNNQLNIATEFSTMLTAISETIAWFSNSFPTYEGYLLKDTLTAQGVSVRSFTTVQTAGLRAQIQALMSTIQ